MIGLGNSVVKRKLAGASVPAAPINIVQPSLSGSGAVGEAVICNRGTWSGSPTPTYTYDFRLDSVSVQNSSSNSYTPLLADDGKTLTCLVTATNSQGSASEGTSNSIVIGIAPSNTIAPTLSPSGTQSTGTVITVGNGTFTGTAPLTYAYRWKRNGSIILGETANTYTIVASDDGTVITAEVKATNAYGESVYIGTSNQVDAVNAIAPVNTVAPVVSGTAVVGQTLSTTDGTWTGIPTPTYSYQWYRGATLISGATNSTYTLVQADAGNTSNIKCVVTATNSAGSASADSNTMATIFDATAWSYIQAANITDSTQRQAANFEMYTMKAGGVTSGYLGLYPLIGGTSDTHKWNMFNAVDSDAAKRLAFSGTITHSSNGMQGNGTNGIADTFINPSIDSTNDFTMWHYTRSNTNDADSSDCGVISGGTNPGIVTSVRLGTRVVTGVNSNISTFTRTTGNISGFWLVKRVGNTITIKYNNSLETSYTAPNLSLLNGKIRLMGIMLLPSTFLDYSNKQYTDFGFLNVGTTDAQDTAIFNAVVGKETILGRNV